MAVATGATGEFGMATPASRIPAAAAAILITLTLVSPGVAEPLAMSAGPAHDTQSDLGRLQADAAAGDPNAMYQLGLRFKQGKGVRRNYDDAVMWFHRAAAADQADAMLELGVLHQNNGMGVPNDNSKAALWYGKAAKLGQGSAMFYLGTLYSDGRGVRQDMVEAYKWLDLATIYAGSEEDRKRAAASRDALGRSKAMSAERMAEAKAQSQEWQRAFALRTTSASRRD